MRKSIVLVVCCAAYAQEDSYRLVQAVNGAGFVERVNALAASGYRVAVWDGSHEIVAVLERLPAGDPKRYRYAVVSQDPLRKLEKGLNGLGAGGFRVLRWTLPPKMLVLEKEDGETATFQYDVRGMMIGPIAKAKSLGMERQGYRRIGLLTTKSGNYSEILLELRERSSAAIGAEAAGFRGIHGSGRVVAPTEDKKLAKLRTQMDEAVGEGFRIETGRLLARKDWEFFAFMRKDAAPPPLEYKLAWDQSEVESAAADGFRLLPCCVFFAESKNGPSVKALLEKRSGDSTNRRYLMFENSDFGSLLARIRDAGQDGYRPVALFPGVLGYSVVMEKAQ